MRKVKFRDKLILYLFFAILVLPSIIWWFISPNLPFEYVDVLQAKKFPEFNSITMKEFPKEFDSYYFGNLPFRVYCLRFYSYVLYKLTGNIETSKVLFGKNGWLFYCDKTDGDPVADYKRINQFTNEELIKITKNLNDLQQYCKKRNCDFVFLIGPNKENIYPEYMPDNIIRTNYTSRTKQLVNYLKANTNIKVIDPTSDLIEAKKDDFVYYKCDTHWNDLGGYVASKLLLDNFGLNLPNCSVLKKEQEYNEDNIYDLADMTGMRKKALFFETNEIRISGYTNLQVEKRPSIVKDEIRMYCQNAPKKEKIMILRDSFAKYMIPVVSAYYQDSVYYMYAYFYKELVDIEKPNLLVFEVVERCFPRLMNYDFEEKN